MAGEVAVTLPAPRPVEGGLLRAARPIPVEWTRGLMLNSSQCIDGLPFPFCNPSSSPESKVSQRPGEAESFTPVGITVTVDCSTLGGDPVKYAEQGLDVLREYIVATELATGGTTANPSLADATLVGSGTDTLDALAVLENEIAERAQGRQAFIHISPGNAVLVSDHLRFADGRWLTPSGHLVVVSPGYAGLDDLHATGDVFAETGGTARLDSVDRNVNTRYVTAEELGIAVFDPCFNISVSPLSS